MEESERNEGVVEADEDAVGRALLDYQCHGLRGKCVYRDGDTVWDCRIRKSHFQAREKWHSNRLAVLRELVDRGGEILDAGCGAGNYSLWLQDEGADVLAVDISSRALQAARDRGVENVQVENIFDMSFDRNRFGSVLCTGTQIGSAGSVAGIRQFLSDLATITDEDGCAIVDSNPPTNFDPDHFPGYRPDPREGFARRCFHAEYARETPDGVDRYVSRTRSVLLFDPSRLEDIVVGTPWEIAEVYSRGQYFMARLEK